MEVMDAIRRKRAVRSYIDRPLPEEIMEKILWAGRRAQSSKNSQPWEFIVVRNKETLKALQQLGDYASYLPTAAMAVGIVTPDPKTRWSVMFDAGQAAANMQLAGVDLGVGSCIVTLHRPEPARDILGFPEDLQLHMLISFGYPTEPNAFEPPARAGGRRPLNEIAHLERWGGKITREE
jgi:nitroreductase